MGTLNIAHLGFVKLESKLHGTWFVQSYILSSRINLRNYCNTLTRVMYYAALSLVAIR